MKVLLASALVYTFAPALQRFELPFIDDEASEEMQVSDFLSKSVPRDTVLYANFNYPVFAYYTSLPVRRIPESGPALYDALSHLPGDGILIAYRPDDAVQEPQLNWLDANPHFHRFHEFPSLVLYEYRGSLSEPAPGQFGVPTPFHRRSAGRKERGCRSQGYIQR